MRRYRGWSDEGRVAIGPFIAALVVAAVGYGAYWMLGEYGFLGGSEEDGEQEVEVEAAVDERPAWLHDTPHELPPLVLADELGPPYHRPAEWVWELVDDTWSMTVIREGEGDNYTWLSDFQALYLVSPTDDLFKISDLRTDFNMDLVHWDLERQVAWIVRGGKSNLEQVIEYHLVSLETTEGFAGNIFSSANVVRGGVANLEYRSKLEDGRELWVTHSPRGYVTGVAFRDGDEWDGSLVSDEIRRMAQQDLGNDRGVDAWFDPEGGRAVYHGVYLDPNTQTLAEEMWLVHDFATDAVDNTAVVPVPRDDCTPVDGARYGTFEGDRLVADCGGTEYLLDPYGLGAPTER